MSRQNLAVATFEMWKDHPWFGVGFGSKVHSRMVSDYLGYQDSHVAHNNYLQIMADTGIFTFGIYALLLGGTIVTLGFSVRRVRRAAPGKEAYPAAIQASLIGFAIGSTFLSRVTFDLLYMVLMCAASWQIVERQLLSNAEVAGQPKEETPGPVSTLAV
jgi:O-antigen ligase